MISYISGVVQKMSFGKDSYVDLLTKTDISYRVHIPQNFTPIEKNQQLSLYTHFHVREDMQSLFGFETEEARDRPFLFLYRRLPVLPAMPALLYDFPKIWVRTFTFTHDVLRKPRAPHDRRPASAPHQRT